MKQSDAAWFSVPSTPFSAPRPELPMQGVDWGGGGDMGRMDTGCMQVLIQDLAFHRLVDKLLSHVFHTRSAVSRGLRESPRFGAPLV